MNADALRRTTLLARHNLRLQLRDPGQLIGYIVMPMIMMLVFKPLYARALSTGTQQAVLGPLVMFSVFALAVVGNGIFVERTWRTWDRLRVSPASHVELLLGKAVPTFLVLLLQQAILLGYGCAVVGLPVPTRTYGYVLLGVAIWGFTLLAIGSVLATTVRSRGDLGIVCDLGAMLASSLGGALAPVALMPGWVRHIAPISPGYWALNLLRDAYDGDLSAMVRPMLVCLAIGAAFGVLASFRLARGWGRSHLL